MLCTSCSERTTVLSPFRRPGRITLHLFVFSLFTCATVAVPVTRGAQCRHTDRRGNAVPLRSSAPVTESRTVRHARGPRRKAARIPSKALTTARACSYACPTSRFWGPSALFGNIDCAKHPFVCGRRCRKPHCSDPSESANRLNNAEPDTRRYLFGK